jgi:hypothetical protein
MFRKSSSLVRLGVLVFLAALPILSACTKDVVEDPPSALQAQVTEDAVLNNLQVAYRNKDINEYSKLLADDFQFYFDAKTRQDKGLPPFWTRLTDSTQTERLFKSDQVSRISIKLTWPPKSAKPVNQIGREDWTYYDILDVLLDVDLAPTTDNPDGFTFRVEDQRQRFYFRKGKTKPAAPGDTLMYIVQWEDYGVESAPGGEVTFSSVKTD